MPVTSIGQNSSYVHALGNRPPSNNMGVTFSRGEGKKFAQLSFQGCVVKVRLLSEAVSDNSSVGGLRGVITEFSSAARRRLLELVNRLTVPADSSFLTLTYPAEFPGPAEAKLHFQAFRKRLERMVGRPVAAIWRLEFQRRGAPHFHVMLFDVPFVDKLVIQRMWSEIVLGYFPDDYKKRPFTRVEKIRSHRKLVNYISKYVAKVSEAGGFNIGAYLAADGRFIHPVTGEIMGKLGRWWGYWNKRLLPFAEEMLIEGPVDVGFYTFRRGIRRAGRALSLRLPTWCKDRDSGFTLFVGDAPRWFHFYVRCLSPSAARLLT